MAGSTYSRTQGARILPGSWAYVQARMDILRAELLTPDDRFSYDVALPETREAFDRLAKAPMTAPPDFLIFSLAKGKDPIHAYPGAVAGPMPSTVASLAPGVTLTRTAAALGALPKDVEGAIQNFRGQVSLTLLQAGAELYRTIGLLAEPGALEDGLITNRIFGGRLWFEPRSPNTNADEAAWRACTAVLKEWNGDYGYIAVRLKRDLHVLEGNVAPQPIPRDSATTLYLPGTGRQYWVARLNENDVDVRLESGEWVSPADRPLRDIILPTRFGSESD